jgi:putative peptidoglycan lipid II flippase
MQFPIGLFGVAISIATLPTLAKLAASKDMKAMGETLVSSLTMAFALTAPAAVGLWVIAKPVVALIFQHGRFHAHDTLMTAEALQFYAIGLMAYSSVKIIVPAFYALNDTRWPVIASFLSVALNIIIILITLKPLQHKAIALSTSLTMLFNFTFLAIILYKKTGGYPAKRLFINLIKILAGSAVMGGAVFSLQNYLGSAQGILLLSRNIFLCIAMGAVSYAILIYILRLSEIREILGKKFLRSWKDKKT